MSKIKGLFEIYKATTTVDDENFLPKEMEVKIHDDRNGNGDDVFKGKGVKYIERQKGKDSHGFDAGKDLKAAQKFDKHKDIPDMSTYSQKALMATEEAEQIDELSKDTLGRYIRKSAGQMGTNAMVVGDRKAKEDWKGADVALLKALKRQHGIGVAVKKIVKENTEETDQINELSNDKMMDYSKKARRSRDTSNDDETVGRRIAGLTLVSRRAKANKALPQYEEVEQIDELSKDTLGRYINRSISQVRNDNRAIGRRDRGRYFGIVPGGDDENIIHQKNKKAAKKREDGIRLATSKLTKEDVIDSVFETYINDRTVSIDPLERLEENLSGLSNKNLELIVGLFNDLTEENQFSFIELTESKEGIDELLDYIINGQ